MAENKPTPKKVSTLCIQWLNILGPIIKEVNKPESYKPINIKRPL